MARTKKSPREPLSNVAARHACITDGFARRFAIEQRIAELEAEHIKPLKDDRSKAWKNVAADTGLAITDLTDQYRIYKRQQLAKLFDEEADRDVVLDAQREIFAALQAGQTLDFLDVLGRAAQAPKRESVFADKPTGAGGSRPVEAIAADIAGMAAAGNVAGAAAAVAVVGALAAEPEGTADQDPLTSPMFVPHRGAGAAAFAAGKGEDACPYKVGSQTHAAWTFGFYRAEGAAAYIANEAIGTCRYTTGSPAWRHWNTGWTDEARKDGNGPEAVGAAAVKGAPRRRRRGHPAAPRPSAVVPQEGDHLADRYGLRLS